MKLCPITYEEIPDEARYNEKGLHLLSSGLKNLKDFPFSAEEQRQQAEAYASKPPHADRPPASKAVVARAANRAIGFVIGESLCKLAIILDRTNMIASLSTAFPATITDLDRDQGVSVRAARDQAPRDCPETETAHEPAHHRHPRRRPRRHHRRL